MIHLDASATMFRPFGVIGRVLLDIVHYLGGMGLLALAALHSIVRPPIGSPPLGQAVSRQLERMFRFGLPLVAVVHVGLGSFLAMQAYFGATFLDGIGPVVGVGLIRNIAPLMSAMVLAGLLAALLTPELRGIGHGALDDDPRWRPDRNRASTRIGGDALDGRTPSSPGRLAAARILAAMLAGPVMGITGALVGIAVGFGVGVAMLKVSRPGFFDLFMEMLWFRDVVGIFLKGMAFGLIAGLFACHEGLTRPEGREADSNETAGASARAATLAGVSILVVNSAWFLLFYHAGPAFGPTLLAPPLL